MTTPAPLQRADFAAHELMAAHPPVLRHPFKRLIFDIACPAGSVHTGTIGYSRWPALPLPPEASAADALPRVTVREDVYDYAPTSDSSNAVEWHVNFADPNLFIAYGSALFAQDEMQVAEHPALGALREALDVRGWPARTSAMRVPTPVLVRHVERRCRFAIDVNAGEGRPLGLYGNSFAAATVDAIRRATTRLEPPTLTNLIAMAAPTPGSGRYRAEDIAQILTTAYSGFRAAVLESNGAPVVVHTGYWGCGAFGGNRVLMTTLQVLAADMAGVSQLIYHTVDAPKRAPCDEALARISSELPAAATLTHSLVARVAAMGFRWGTSDGN